MKKLLFGVLCLCALNLFGAPLQTLYVGKFVGDGAGLSNAGSTTAQSPLTVDVAGAGHSITGVSNVAVTGLLSGNGAGVTNVNAANLTGTLGLPQLPVAAVTNGTSADLMLSNRLSIYGFSYPDGIFQASPLFGNVNLGDYANDVHQTKIQISDSSQTITIKSTNGTSVIGPFSAPGITGVPASGITGTLAAAQLPGIAVTNDSIANAYFARNNITTQNEKTAVYGQMASAKAFGIYSNLVALANLDPRFHPTNHFDVLGNQYSVFNEQYTNGGLFCVLTNFFVMDGFSLTNWTLVVTMDRQVLAPTASTGGLGFNPLLAPYAKTLLFGFENTNTGSANYVDYGEFYGTMVYQKNGSVWGYGTNINAVPSCRPVGLLGGANQANYTVQKEVYCFSSTGTTNYLWINTLPVYGAGGASQPITSTVLCTDLLQRVVLGASTNYTQDIWNNDPQYHTNGAAVYESVMLFNTAATPAKSNLLYGSYQMAQWPDWPTPYNYLLGDSIMAVLGGDTESPAFVPGYTNDFFYLYNSVDPMNHNWMNNAQGGSSLKTALTNAALGTVFPITPVSLLPQIIMGVPVIVWSDLGRNDQYTNGPEDESTNFTFLTQFATPYKALSPVLKWIQIQTPPVALTNGFPYTLLESMTLNSNIDMWNRTSMSNSVVDGTLNLNFAFNTNNIAIGNGVSSDGVHPYTNNSGFLAMARWAHGIQTDFLTPLYVGSFTGNGSGLTNLGTAGLAQMAAGTVTVSTTAIQRNSKLMLTYISKDGTVASIYYKTNDVTPGTSFIIRSSNAADTNNVNWFIVP